MEEKVKEKKGGICHDFWASTLIIPEQNIVPGQEFSLRINVATNI